MYHWLDFGKYKLVILRPHFQVDRLIVASEEKGARVKEMMLVIGGRPTITGFQGSPGASTTPVLHAQLWSRRPSFARLLALYDMGGRMLRVAEAMEINPIQLVHLSTLHASLSLY